MKIIALDSSGLVASAAVMEIGEGGAEDRLLAEYTVQHKKTHSQTLLPMLAEIMKMADTEPKDIGAVAVAKGPGSFTGLRIGSATAKGLGLALGIPLIEVSTLEALALNLPLSSGLVCPIMDARRGQVYSGIYRADGQEMRQVREDKPISVEELAAEIEALPSEMTAGGVYFLGDGVPVYRGVIDGALHLPHEYAPAGTNRQRAALVGLCAVGKWKRGETVSAAAHVPTYLRKSQAEREREERAAKEGTD